jgi:integrase
MAAIKTVELANGKKRYRFVIDVGRDASGKRQQRTYTFARMRDAKAELARLTGAVGDGVFVDRSRETVSEALDRYIKSACFERADNTRISYTLALQPVKDRLGHRKLQSLTRQDIEQLRDWMLKAGRKRGGKPGTGLGPRSVRLTLGRLKAALEMACEDGRLAVNPARHVRMPSQPKRDGTTWSEDELRQFLAVADADRLAAAWRLALYGLRRGEVTALRWEDIDLDAGTVTVGRSRVVLSGAGAQEVIVKPPKSERGYRTLPLDDVLTAALRALHKRQAAERLASGQAYQPSGYVVTDELGAAVNPEWFSDEFHRVAATAGVPRIRLHDGRHTVNSLLAAAGVPPHIRAAWCGHSEAVNERTYTHARPEDLATAGAVLSRICGTA